MAEQKWIIYDILNVNDGTPSWNLKYKYVQGFCVKLDVDKIKIGESLRMYFTANPVNIYWDTSNVVTYTLGSEWVELTKETVLRITTLNSIYVLIKV